MQGYNELNQYTLSRDQDALEYFSKKLINLENTNNFTKNNIKSEAKYDTIFLNDIFKERIKAYCIKKRISPFNFYLGSYLLLLNKILQKDKLVIGIPIANRPTKESRLVVGYFVNTLPLVWEGTEDISIEDMFLKLSTEVQSLKKYKNINIKDLIQDNKNLVQNKNIFDNVITYYKDSLELSLPDCEITFEMIKRVDSQFPLSLVIEETKKGNYMHFIREEGIMRDVDLEDFMTKIIENILEDDQKKISQIRLLDDKEWGELIKETRLSIKGIEDFESETIVSLLEKKVEEQPQVIACRYDNVEITYGQLSHLSKSIGSIIKNIQSNSKIVLLLPIGINQIIGIFSILYAGKTYIPIDLNAPQERVQYILEDSQSKLIITTSEIATTFSLPQENILFIDELLEENLDQISDNLKHTFINPENPAYIIYTSGTTGKPKGVAVTHNNVVSLIKSTQKLFRFNSQDIWSMLHSYSFDFSVWEIFGSLINGATLVIVPDHIRKSHELFWKFIKKEKVTILNQTPSYFMQLSKFAVKNPNDIHLRTIVFGGEKLNFTSLKQWTKVFSLDKPELINMYGITETTVHVTYHKITKEDIVANRSIIGKAIPFWGITILDANENPQLKGIPGEICVFGKGVTQGYFNKEDITKKKFKILKIASENNLLYKSGDLGLVNQNNQIEYLERNDQQIKIRGYRIEIKEIESAMLEHEFCNMAAVKVVTFDDNDDRLIGYYVPTDDLLNTRAFKKFLIKKLPQYMVPSLLIKKDKIPLTINGKIDYGKLEFSNEKIENTNNILTEEDTLEEGLIKILQDILKIDVVGLDDNFFDLGGNSLLMSSLSEKINNFLKYKGIYNKEINIIDVYQYPTVRKLVKYLKKADHVSV